MKGILTKYSLSIAGGLIALLHPAIPFVLICFGAILFDCWTAWRLSNRVKRTTGLSSAKFQSKKADKIIETGINALLFIILAMFVNDHITIPYGNLYLPNIAAGFVVGVQLISVLENISSCNDKWWAKKLQLVFVDKSSRHYDSNIDMEKKSILSRLKSPTPAKWKTIRNTCGYLLAAMVAIGGVSATVPSVTTPQWFSSYGWYAGAFLAGVIAYAQSKEEQKNEQD